MISGSECNCATLAGLAVVPMGEHEGVFDTLSEVRRRGMPWWWLGCAECRACGQVWLIAQEERQNDIFIMRKLDADAGYQLVSNDVWPTDFDRFERLLEIGRDSGHRVSFVDPLGDSSLIDTAGDLAQERPGIRVSELASLLALPPALAAEVARQAVADRGVTITFPAT